jgi:hypothetical protein
VTEASEDTVAVPNSVVCSAELVVDRPVAATLALFTAEGERQWVPGWDATFPDPDRTHGVGAVFVTGGTDHTTTWVVVDQREDGVRYTRVTPGRTAGTVSVTVLEAHPARTQLRVDYDLTALTDAGGRWLADFAENFVDHVAQWQRAIADIGR